MVDSRDMDLPIVCTLSTADLEERKDTILASVRATVIGRTSIPGGYRYEFKNDPRAMSDIHRMVELEQQCCRFLHFDLSEDEKALRLNVTGPPEALAVIGDLFG